MKIGTLRRAATILVLGLAAPAAAFGQDFGVKAGANSASITVDPPAAGVTIGAQNGFVGGVFGTKKIAGVLGLEVDVLFAIKGAKSKSATGSSFSFSYFTAPILARLKISACSGLLTR